MKGLCPSSQECCTSPVACGANGTCRDATADTCSGGAYFPSLCFKNTNLECCVTGRTAPACYPFGTKKGVCRPDSLPSAPGYTYYSGYCNGPSNYRCYSSFNTNCQPGGSGIGTCQHTSKSCSGTYFSGFCSDPDPNVKCCAASTECKPVSGNLGKCQDATHTSCDGQYYVGYCSDPSLDVLCCSKPLTMPTQEQISATTIGCEFSGLTGIVKKYCDIGEVDTGATIFDPNNKCCIPDCAWSTWSEWTSCSKTCGTGERSRSRNRHCPVFEIQKETKACYNLPCACNEKVSFDVRWETGESFWEGFWEAVKFKPAGTLVKFNEFEFAKKGRVVVGIRIYFHLVAEIELKLVLNCKGGCSAPVEIEIKKTKEFEFVVPYEMKAIKLLSSGVPGVNYLVWAHEVLSVIQTLNDKLDDLKYYVDTFINTYSCLEKFSQKRALEQNTSLPLKVEIDNPIEVPQFLVDVSICPTKTNFTSPRCLCYNADNCNWMSLLLGSEANNATCYPTDCGGKNSTLSVFSIVIKKHVEKFVNQDLKVLKIQLAETLLMDMTKITFIAFEKYDDYTQVLTQFNVLEIDTSTILALNWTETPFVPALVEVTLVIEGNPTTNFANLMTPNLLVLFMLIYFTQ